MELSVITSTFSSQIAQSPWFQSMVDRVTTLELRNKSRFYER